MTTNRYLRTLHTAAEAARRHGVETNRNCTVKEVKEEGGERKVRCVMGIRPDGSEWLSPWMSTQEQRSGQERSQSAIKPGQNGVIQGTFRQGTFSAQGESTQHAPQPTHAPKHNGPTSSVGKKLRSAMNGGEDDQQQQGGGGGSGGGGSGGSSGGQQQKKYPKEHFSASWIAKEEEKLEKWKPQSGKPQSTTKGGSGGGQTTGGSQQAQQGQKQQQQKEERAMQQVMHEKEGFTNVIGKGDDAVRTAAHPKGSKVRAGKENYFVAEKDKSSYMWAKKDVYVNAVDGKHYVKDAWIIKKSPKDPVPNHDLSDDA